MLLNGLTAGKLHLASTGQAEFCYDHDYLHSEAPVPLSISLPLRDQPFSWEATIRWGDGLRPDNQPLLENWYRQIAAGSKSIKRTVPSLGS